MSGVSQREWGLSIVAISNDYLWMVIVVRYVYCLIYIYSVLILCLLYDYLFRLVRVDNGLSTTTANSDSFFFHDESFGRDKYLLERQREATSEVGSCTPRSSIVSGENNTFVDKSPPVYAIGEKSRIFAGGQGGSREPLLNIPS